MPTTPTSGPGGGYTPPTARGVYFGNAVSVANGQIASLTWDSLLNGTDLLDRTDPANPTIITTGIYVVAVEAFGASLTVGGYIALELSLDELGVQAVLGPVWSPVSNATDDSPRLAVTSCSYLQSGAVVQANGTNHDGAATRDIVLMNGIVQRIT